MSLNFDFTGISAWNPLASPNVEEGPYKTTVIDVDPAYNSGKSTKFTVRLDVGPSAGQETDLYLGNEPGEKGGNLKKWKQALLALATAAGTSQEKAEAGITGKLSIDPTTVFKGKAIHILVTAVPGVNRDPVTGVDRPNLPNKEFITAGQYASLMAAHVSKPATPAANGATTPATAAAAASPASSGDVLNKLFGG